MPFIFIILVIGILTSFTDLRIKKISNQHLAIGAILALLSTIFTYYLKHEHVLAHITNGIFAFIVGFFMFRSSLWRGGDAKLFTLYAFLMPPPAYNLPPFPNVISLFACSFIAGMIILFPIFIKDIVINRNTITNKLFSIETRQSLIRAILPMITYSWVLFPVYKIVKIINPIIIILISYLIFNSEYYAESQEEKHEDILKRSFTKLCLYVLLGIVLRIWISPNSLSPIALIPFMILMIFSAVISTSIRIIFDHFKHYDERVPFAPLLFIGCLLSYTPFLGWTIHIAHRLNVLRPLLS